MLSKVVIKNFCSIKDEVTIKINKNITAIIGKNESGKSTILRAINKLNGEKIEPNDKNVNLKSEPSYIIGYFILDESLIESINQKYEENNSFGFYSLPTDFGNLYYTVEVRDSDNSKYYALYYLDDKKKYIRISVDMFKKRIIEKLKDVVKENDLTEEQKKFISSLYVLSEEDIKRKLSSEINSLHFSDEIKELLSNISSQISKNHWISLLPKYRFIYFSSFDSILQDTVPFSEVSNNQQAKNFLDIANINLEELKKAFETGDEQELEDLGTQCKDIVSKKFKEIFQQTDVEFSLKVRFGSINKNLNFFTQDKTSGNKTIYLSKRSDGFKWYLSLYLTLYDYLNSDNPDINYVILLDEPNLYLHPGAQNNLLHNVFYNEFKDTQIIYTTHSPYMIDPNNSYSIRIVEKDNESIVYNSSREYAEKTKNIKDVDTISPLLTALDLNISNSLIVDDKNILVTVEGIQDVYILTSMIKKNKMNTKFKNIKFISGMSASKVPYLYSYLYGMGYNVYALFDNDKPGNDAISDIVSGDLECDLVNKLLKYDLVNPSQGKFLLEDLFSAEDREKYLPTKSTVLYKRIFDNIEELDFTEETLNNFNTFLKELLKKLK